jgi:hypothetical protein
MSKLLNTERNNDGSADPRLSVEFRQTTSHGLSRRGPKMNESNAGSIEKRVTNRSAIGLPSRLEKR